jgi:glycosyltransferase involved in cell wall biosynthesis
MRKIYAKFITVDRSFGFIVGAHPLLHFGDGFSSWRFASVLAFLSAPFHLFVLQHAKRRGAALFMVDVGEATHFSPTTADSDHSLSDAASLSALPTRAALAEHPADQKPSRLLNGHIDIATRTHIEGWVWDPQTPDDRIELELIENGRELARTVADRDRPSLVQSGIGDGRHAFRLDIPSGLLSGALHHLDLRCAATGVAIPGSPITLDQAAEPPPPTLRWHIDEITDAGVIGWAFSPIAPSRRCVVALREGPRLHSRAAASRSRPGLREAGLGDGACAFLLPLPHCLLDGEDHVLDIIEEHTGTQLTPPVVWRSTAGTAGTALTGLNTQSRHTQLPPEPDIPAPPPPRHTIEWRTSPAADNTQAGAPYQGSDLATRLLFDISDLVYWIGENTNLTGIQRVQSSIVLSLLDGALPPDTAAIFISYNTATRCWEAIPTDFLIALLRDLFLPEFHRIVAFSTEDATRGHLPGARPFDAPGVLDDGTPSVLCLLGAGWNKPDHLHRILAYKRRHGSRFVMLVHDLVPIYARDTCDQPTAEVFEAFLRRAVCHADHLLAVSENTARDLRRYITSLGTSLGRPDPTVTVTRNGSSFDEFLSPTQDRAARDDLPARFVLFVSTIEGRKNHRFIFDLWRRLEAAGDDPPHLVCVGRIGWRAERFVTDLVESRYLDGKIILLQDISDTRLKTLYEQCLFTVYPSLYEGWGLPVGEALAAGKICVCSDRASLPEVVGDAGTCIPLDDSAIWLDTLRTLITDEASRRRQESMVRARYRPVTWAAVAATIASACCDAAGTSWPAPYPAPAIPYGTEISFAKCSGEPDSGLAGGLQHRIADSRRGHFLPDPLTDVSFLLGEDARADGTWAEPEPWGTWLCSPTGDLWLGLPPSDDSLFCVFLRLRTSGPAAGLPARMFANAEIVWQGGLPSRSQDLMLRVRRRTLSDGAWQLRLRIEADISAAVRQQIAEMDIRTPLIGVEHMVVVPGNDIRTRLDVLTTLQLNTIA